MLIPLLVPSPAAAQAATISVDDDTPDVLQTVNVTTTCPGPGTFLFVSVTIFTIPAIANAADPPFFFSADATSTFPLTFNVADDFTIRASCTYAEGTAPNSELVLAVTPTPPTDTGAPPTDSGAPPPTTGPVSPTSAAVSPTSAANVTTDPGQLPPTGASDSTALVAVIVLGLGALVLFATRKFRALDE